MKPQIAQHSSAPAARQPRLAEASRRILAVDDDSAALSFIEEELLNLGYEVETAAGGADALAHLAAEDVEIDAILLDRAMPEMDGLSVVRRLKHDPRLRRIPVVMLNADDDPDEARKALDAGACHNLAKPLDTTLLKSVLDATLRDAFERRATLEELRTQRNGFRLVDTITFKLRTLDEAMDLARFTAACFAEPERVLPGLGELLVNAVEHGNLGIGFETKAELLRSGGWRDEIERRLTLPIYRDRAVTVAFSRRKNGECVIITDQGDGFDWRRRLAIDPSLASSAHGRGIAQARALSFDKIAFNERGNQVVALVSNQTNLEW